MNTGERPVVCSVDSLPSLVKETYKLCMEYIKNKDVLDIGCGEGYGELFIFDIAKTITAIDVDEKVIKAANLRFEGSNIKFCKMSGEKLNFSNESFDVVISSQSIEHINNDNEFLNEVKRVLRSNGIFICLTPNKLSLIPNGERIFDAPYYPFHVREYTPQQFYALVGSYFQVIKRFSFYNPDRSLKFLNSFRGRMIYRISRFRFIRFIARNLSLEFKKNILLCGTKEFNLDPGETVYCEYSDNLNFNPEVIGVICKKLV